MVAVQTLKRFYSAVGMDTFVSKAVKLYTCAYLSCASSAALTNFSICMTFAGSYTWITTMECNKNKCCGTPISPGDLNGF